jgi:hypothetical protein
MANFITVGGNGRFFVNEAKVVKVEVLDTAQAPISISGWTTRLLLKKKDTDADANAVLSCNGTIIGTFNAERRLNSQRAQFAITANQTSLLVPRKYQYSVKRTDANSETVLIYGEWEVERTTQ